MQLLIDLQNTLFIVTVIATMLAWWSLKGWGWRKKYEALVDIVHQGEIDNAHELHDGDWYQVQRHWKFDSTFHDHLTTRVYRDLGRIDEEHKGRASIFEKAIPIQTGEGQCAPYPTQQQIDDELAGF